MSNFMMALGRKTDITTSLIECKTRHYEVDLVGENFFLARDGQLP